MSACRIALLTTTVAMILVAIPSPSAAAETPTIPQLRTHLRQVRTSLQRASGILTGARTDLRNVRAVVTAAGGLPALVPFPAVTEPEPSPSPTSDATPEPLVTSAPDPDAPGTGAATTDPAADIGVLVAALRPGLAARLLADGAVTADELSGLERRVVKWRRVVSRLRRMERTLKARIALRLRIARWNRNGAWRPLIEIAARRRGISPDGLYRLMMAESGGRRFAGTTYKGLFQYYPGTWRGRWNPWRSQSIYNGWAQIQATAYAIDRSMGPTHWPSTYWRAF